MNVACCCCTQQARKVFEKINDDTGLNSMLTFPLLIYPECWIDANREKLDVIDWDCHVVLLFFLYIRFVFVW